ncbi:MAG: tetratricopeptide repeat protein [Silvibacterium sp.]
MLPFRSCRGIPLTCALFLCWTAVAAAQSAAGTNQSPADGVQSGESFQSIVQAANAARDSGNADEAIQGYSRAVALRPNWAEGWWDLGTTQYETNHYTEAVASLRRLVVLTPNTAAGWSILGLSEFETKDYVAALSSLEKAQKLGGIDDPDIARVTNYHLALLLIRNGEFDRAADLLHSVFGASPSSQVKTALGLALLRTPLLPSEIDPSQDALVQAAGDAASSADTLQALEALTTQHPQAPWLHYAYGLALAAAGQPENALVQQKLEAAISPASALPWIEVSSLSLQLKRTKQALSAAEHAVSLDAKSSAAHEALAKALTATGRKQQAALETREAARLSQTPPHRDPRMIALYGDHSTSLSPQDSATWNVAMKDYSARSYPETIAALKSWVEHNPSDGTAWAVMGLSEFALKDYDNARIHLQRGINLGLKGSPQALQLATDRLVVLLIRNGEFDTATTLLEPMARKSPLAAQTELEVGLALLRIPAFPEDLNASQRDLAQSVGAIVPMLLASRYSEAFPAFQKLIAEYPTAPWLHYAYGDALDSLSQYDDAKAQMRAEINLSPHSALPWIRLASISERQHLPADALKAAQTAVGMSPGSAEAHYELGRAWLESGDAQKSIAELDKANGLKPDNPEIHFALARAYAKANQPEKAAAERATFMQLKALASQKTQNAAQGDSILKTNTQ